jgi:transposase InsO family protein
VVFYNPNFDAAVLGYKTQNNALIQKEFMYLVAVIDWHSRYVLSWELSNTVDTLHREVRLMPPRQLF